MPECRAWGFQGSGLNLTLRVAARFRMIALSSAFGVELMLCSGFGGRMALPVCKVVNFSDSEVLMLEGLAAGIWVCGWRPRVC